MGNFEFMQTEIPDDHISVADHYKGTPPLKTKKKPGGKNRYSGSDYQVKSGDEIPPPLPPKGIRNGAEETATETLPQRPLRGRSSKDGTPVQGRTSQQSM